MRCACLALCDATRKWRWPAETAAPAGIRASCGAFAGGSQVLAGIGKRQPNAGGYPALGNDVWMAVRPVGRTLQMERYGKVY